MAFMDTRFRKNWSYTFYAQGRCIFPDMSHRQGHFSLEIISSIFLKYVHLKKNSLSILTYDS